MTINNTNNTFSYTDLPYDINAYIETFLDDKSTGAMRQTCTVLEKDYKESHQKRFLKKHQYLQKINPEQYSKLIYKYKSLIPTEPRIKGKFTLAKKTKLGRMGDVDKLKFNPMAFLSHKVCIAVTNTKIQGKLVEKGFDKKNKPKSQLIDVDHGLTNDQLSSLSIINLTPNSFSVNSYDETNKSNLLKIYTLTNQIISQIEYELPSSDKVGPIIHQANDYDLAFTQNDEGTIYLVNLETKKYTSLASGQMHKSLFSTDHILISSKNEVNIYHFSSLVQNSEKFASDYSFKLNDHEDVWQIYKDLVFIFNKQTKTILLKNFEGSDLHSFTWDSRHIFQKFFVNSKLILIQEKDKDSDRTIFTTLTHKGKVQNQQKLFIEPPSTINNPEEVDRTKVPIVSLREMKNKVHYVIRDQGVYWLGYTRFK